MDMGYFISGTDPVYKGRVYFSLFTFAWFKQRQVRVHALTLLDPHSILVPTVHTGR